MASDKILNGLRVLELCDNVAGPYCARMLADLGAEVIKIEPPSGDSARHTGPFYRDEPHPDHSALFLYVNLNKESVTLDITTATGRKIFERLAEVADVLIEDRTPGALDAIGLGAGALWNLNRGLIVASVTPFGQTGPYRHYASTHLTSYHAGGEGYLLRADPIERPPVQAGRWMGDFEAAVGLSCAIMAAIYWRSFSGQGQHIDMSKQEWSLNLQRMHVPRYRNEGRLESRATQASPWAGTMKCKDGYICMLPNEEHHWRALVEWMGNPEWAADPRFQRAFDRSKNGVELTKHLSEWVSGKSKQELQEQGQARGVPIAMFSTPEDLLHSEQLKARGFFVEVDHPKIGRQAYPSVPYRFSATPACFERPAPTLGQHNVAIYKGLLGYSAEDLVRLRDLEII